MSVRGPLGSAPSWRRPPRMTPVRGEVFNLVALSGILPCDILAFYLLQLPTLSPFVSDFPMWSIVYTQEPLSRRDDNGTYYI